MKQRSGNRILAWALGLSIAVHVAFAIAMREIRPVEAAAEQPPQHTWIVRIPPPTPTPKPVPPRTPHATLPSHAVAVRPAVAPPRLPTAGGAQHGAGHVTAPVASPGVDVGSPEPGTPAPSPKPACSDPNEPARTLAVVPPEQPEDAGALPATAQVEVTLDAAGRVLDATIYHSTNEMSLDRAALRAARATTYAPALVDCLPTGGQYLFRVDFQP